MQSVFKVVDYLWLHSHVQLKKLDRLWEYDVNLDSALGRELILAYNRMGIGGDMMSCFCLVLKSKCSCMHWGRYYY